jgi:hypothetical protein
MIIIKRCLSLSDQFELCPIYKRSPVMYDKRENNAVLGRPLVFLAVIVLFMLAATFAGAAGHEGGPPFRNGEVVVAGAPGPHLDGLEVKKYLPNADLTVVNVERGREFAMVQRFKNRGRKAGLNYIAHATAVPDDFYYPFQWHFTAVQLPFSMALYRSTGRGCMGHKHRRRCGSGGA